MEKKPLFSIKNIVAIGIGAAVFIILGRFATLPSGVPNTEIQTAYAFLALMAAIYGPVVGFCIGFIGHLLKDVISYGSPWISWVISSGLVGAGIGLVSNKLKLDSGEFGIKQILIFNVAQILANIAAWVAVAPALDILIYQEPANKILLQGVVASVANMVTVGVIGTILLIVYAKTRTKKDSLKQED